MLWYSPFWIPYLVQQCSSPGHPKLVEYKNDRNWDTMSGDYLVFPGGGTQFKYDVARYIQFVEQVLRDFTGRIIDWDFEYDNFTKMAQKILCYKG